MVSSGRRNFQLATLSVSFAFLLAVYLLILSNNDKAFAQTPPITPTAPAAPTGPSGTATVENQIIVYQTLSDIADELSKRIRLNGGTTKNAPKRIFMQDINGVTEITSLQSFLLTRAALLDGYKHIQAGFVMGGAPNEYMSAAASLITAVKSSATYTNQTFQPSATSMVNLLTASLHDDSKGTKGGSVAVWSSQNPGDLPAAAKAISDLLNELDAARFVIVDPAKRKDMDALFANFRTSLASPTADGSLLATVIKGQALVKSLGDDYEILNYSVDGAGGDTKTTHWFLWELILPTWRPSYNGGAAVSFTLMNKDGSYVDGGLLWKMYTFSKWSGPKIGKSSNF
ncbi:MAG: hypothetical protein ABSA54_12665 [Terriglobales bacterium]|jgi:hypothetical protein